MNTKHDLEGFGKKFEYGSEVHRLVAVYQCLMDASLRGWAVPMKKLTALVGVDRRTIHRYFGKLEKEPHKLTIQYCEHKRGHHIYNPKRESYFKIGEGLLHRHMVALEVARQALAVFDGANFADFIHQSIEKLRGGLARTEAIGMGVPISKLVSFRTPGAGVVNAAVFEAITETLFDNRVLEIAYKPRSKTMKTERLKLEPLHLACVGDRWVLVARDRARKQDDHPIRTYVIARLYDPIKTSMSFTYPEDFEPEHHLESAFGVRSSPGDSKSIMVKLWISERGAHHVLERKWHPTQKVQNLPTGAIEAAFLVSDTGEITRWILSFGSDCKVLAPEKLREEIAAEAHNVLDLYRTKSAYPT